MQFARVNDVVLHYEDRGDPGAPVLVFSNSLGTDFRIWDAVVDGLGGRFRFIRYDSRGHGLSEATPQPYTIDTHVADLAALLDHLGVRRAIVVGLSVGGVVAQGLAAARPDLVAALILCGTAPRIGTEALWNERISTVNAKGVTALAGSVMQRWFPSSYRESGIPDFVAYTAMLSRTSADGYAGTCAALRDADLTETTRALTVPTLCMVGSEDGSTPPDLVRGTAGLIAGSEFHIIEGAGHLPCIDRPGAVADLIGGFAGRIAS